MNDDAESNRINATALTRIDPKFQRLNATASQVAVYRYCASSESWDKTDTAGCLFLYDRSVHPQYGLVVMNRKNANNFVQKFGPDARFVMDQPYILIRAVEDLHTDPRDDNSSSIYCIWFYDAHDCVATANKLRNMGLKFEGEGNTFDKVGETARCHLDENSPTSMGNHAGNVLFQILRKGKDAHLGRMVPDNIMTARELEKMMLTESADHSHDNSNAHNSEYSPSKKVVSREELVNPLTKDQLQQAFLYLVQNDSDFVKKLHDGYTKSLDQGQARGGR